MRRAGALLLLATLALVSACGDNQPALPPAPEAKDKLTRFEFAIDGARYAISLPEQAGIREQRDPGSVTFDARRGQRLQKLMVLSATPQKSGQTLDRQYRLRGGTRVVRYRQTDDDGGGSAGAMASIDGEFQVGPHTLFLSCSDQSEGSLDPAWCLEYLETLLPADAGKS